MFPTLTNLILSVPILDENWHFGSQSSNQRDDLNVMVSHSLWRHIRSSRRATPI
jgi:hypothetical protein